MDIARTFRYPIFSCFDDVSSLFCSAVFCGSQLHVPLHWDQLQRLHQRFLQLQLPAYATRLLMIHPAAAFDLTLFGA